uniref:Uncharacterized protein n=1 Tax=Anguilla anguilla TaxID=7936 RepID=A0A0E9WAG3_ANGAN
MWILGAVWCRNHNLNLAELNSSWTSTPNCILELDT